MRCSIIFRTCPARSDGSALRREPLATKITDGLPASPHAASGSHERRMVGVSVLDCQGFAPSRPIPTRQAEVAVRGGKRRPWLWAGLGLVLAGGFAVSFACPVGNWVASFEHWILG